MMIMIRGPAAALYYHVLYTQRSHAGRVKSHAFGRFHVPLNCYWALDAKINIFDIYGIECFVVRRLLGNTVYCIRLRPTAACNATFVRINRKVYRVLSHIDDRYSAESHTRVNSRALTTLCTVAANLGLWQERSSATVDGSRHALFSKFVLCFTSYGSYKGFKQQKWPSRSFNGIGNGAIGSATYDFLLVFHCNYVSILHRYLTLITQNLKR